METNRQNDEAEDGAVDEGTTDDLVLLADLPGWRMTRFALRLTQIGMAVALVTTVPSYALLSAARADNLAVVLAGYAFAGATLASIFALCAGRYLCCVVPVESAARQHALRAAVSCSLLLIAVGVLYVLNQDTATEERFIAEQRLNGRDFLIIMAGLLAFAIHAVGHLSFVLFLRAIARFLHDKQIIADATLYVASFGIFAALFLAMGGIGPILLNVNDVGGCLVFLVIVAGFALFARFFILVCQTHDLLAQALRRVES